MTTYRVLFTALLAALMLSACAPKDEAKTDAAQAAPAEQQAAPATEQAGAAEPAKQQ